MRLLPGLFCSLFLLASCATKPVATPEFSAPSQPTSPAPSTQPSTPTVPVTVPAACKSGTWCGYYDSIIVPKITDAVLMAKVGDLCPNYEKSLAMKVSALNFAGPEAKTFGALATVTPDTVAFVGIVNRVKFWVMFTKAIALAESNWKIAPAPFLEPGMGNDPVTGLPVYSEGLMQLSYQDARSYSKQPTCAAISYPKKNITEPTINLGCSMEIYDRLVTRYPTLSVTESLGKYWSTVRTTTSGGKRMRVQLKKDMPECFS